MYSNIFKFLANLFCAICCIIFLFTIPGYSQTVGLVLSGGGAKGLAHIGVIKTLEEHNIPIDYIAGTSMGAIIGGLYAIGYSPYEMEVLLKSDEFKQWSYGEIDIDKTYYFKNPSSSAKWVEMPVVKQPTGYKLKLPTNIIAPEQMDLRFMQFLEPAGAGADYDFNNLMVPYLCVASDVHKNLPVILNSGSLSAAIRASMTFPGYFKPIEIDSVLLFDGGMQNNFPADIMDAQFNPDIIIGSKVASNPGKPDADDIYKQLENVFMKATNYEIPTNGVLIEPDVDAYGLLDFEDFDSLYQKGIEATLEKIDTLEMLISRRQKPEEINQKRYAFKQKYKPILIDNIFITGVNSGTVEYILRNIKRNRDLLTFSDFELEYFKLLSDNLIQSVYPNIIYNDNSGYYDLYLKITMNPELSLSFGGNISSNLRNMAYVGINYGFQKQNSYNLSSNIILGQFYNSVTGKFKMEFPPRNISGNRVISPFFVDVSGTFNYWDYFEITSDWFVDSKSPSKIKQNEMHFQSNFGRPISIRGLLYTGFSYGRTTDSYFQTNLVEQQDVPDETIFDFSSLHCTYEFSTLNFEEYPLKGRYFRIQGRYTTGLERYTAGTTADPLAPQYQTAGHSWVHLSGQYQQYLPLGRHFVLGGKAHAVLSNKSVFTNSYSNLLSTYAYYPFPQSKLVLLQNFRADNYIAAGVIPVIKFTETISLRGEVYLFQPYRYLLLDEFFVTYSNTFPKPSIAGSFAAVYQSPIGSLALTASYFQNEEQPYYFQLNFGYVLFNKKGLD